MWYVVEFPFLLNARNDLSCCQLSYQSSLFDGSDAMDIDNIPPPSAGFLLRRTAYKTITEICTNLRDHIPLAIGLPNALDSVLTAMEKRSNNLRPIHKIAVIGPQGVGKSTLYSAMVRQQILPTSGGTVRIPYIS